MTFWIFFVCRRGAIIPRNCTGAAFLQHSRCALWRARLHRWSAHYQVQGGMVYSRPGLDRNGVHGWRRWVTPGGCVSCFVPWQKHLYRTNRSTNLIEPPSPLKPLEKSAFNPVKWMWGMLLNSLLRLGLYCSLFTRSITYISYPLVPL